MKNEYDLYKQALDAWGGEAQVGMVQEECAELIVVLNKYNRGQATVGAIIDEIADVDIMLRQLLLILSLEKEVSLKKTRCTFSQVKERKLLRLKQRLEAFNDVTIDREIKSLS